MSYSVAGKYAVITGAGSGINFCFAKLLLERGAAGVLIGDLALRPHAQEFVAAHADKVSFRRTDVRSWPDISALMAQGAAQFPQVDIVCAGAGIFEPPWSSFWSPPRTATNPDSPSVDAAGANPGTYAVIDVNLTHPIRLTQLAMSHWLGRGIPGCMVYAGSTAGYVTSFASPMYIAAKSGLHGFVRSIGGIKEELNIRVGAIAPGGVRTPMMVEEKKHIFSAADIENMVTPEECAEAMLALCEKDEYGDGTILEVVEPGQTRVVPLYGNVPPTGRSMVLGGYREFQENLYKSLRENGLKV
ncbi:uncharacterized protein E0L32_007143 [Thyridium curvatum]|uniref:Uncharacterized protein n=1 Tax=Thyridium curvatum TaxID=1093900 RepID=A0A507AXN0_9PEZI|nr:uncharacterized protein E0L32_007143 [Thyridium curvatum]TPX12257.1 hypothetical protein E0L32_007143 [Thyridium curvatum]